MALKRLFWVTTGDHCEDWFVIAGNAKEAAEYFENFEGYDTGDASAEAILDIPEETPVETGWPSEDILEVLGATTVSDGFTRVIQINGRKFCEGLLEATIRMIDDDAFEASGQGRINQTKKEDTQH